MKIIDIAVDRPITMLMLCLVGIFLGIISVYGLPIDLFPELELPFLFVQTEYPNVGPEEIESEITQIIEEAVAPIENVKKVLSTSQEGLSFVFVEFEWGTNLDISRMDVREAVDRIKAWLPDEAEDPIISKFDIGGESAISLVVGGRGTIGLDQVRKITEDKLKPAFEQIEGVASAEVRGGLEREIQVNLDLERLKAYSLPFSLIGQRISQENKNKAGGRIDEETKEYLVRTVSEYESIEELANVILYNSDGRVIRLKDIANVEDTFKERREYAFLNKNECVTIAIMKESDGNTVQIADAVKAKMKELEKKYPMLKIDVGFDFSDFIKGSIQMVKENAMYGAIFAIIVLMLFLRSIRSTFIVTMAIPISIAVTFIPIYFRDMTLNLLSLGGLALGIGMLLDNSIVVVENVFRHIQMGKEPKTASKIGANEMFLAIVASTLTTLFVFLPLSWIEGIAKEIFTDMALTVTYSLLASLIVAITLVPTMCARILKKKKNNPVAGAAGKGSETVDNTEDAEMKVEIPKTMGRISSLYWHGLRWTIRWRLLVIPLAFLMFVGSIFGFKLLGMEFFPEMDRGLFAVHINMPEGTSLVKTLKVSKQVEEYAVKHEAVLSVVRNVKPQSATLAITLKDVPDRPTTFEVMTDMRDITKNIAGADVNITQDDEGGGGGGVLQIKLSGEDSATLRRLAQVVKKEVALVPGAVDVSTDGERGRPELQISINRDRAQDAGLSTDYIADSINTAMAGTVFSQYREAGDDIDIRVQLARRDREDIDDIKNLVMVNDLGESFYLRQIADIKMANGPVKIARQDQERVVNITGNVAEGANLGNVSTEINKRMVTLSKEQFPPGYTYNMEGETKDMIEAFVKITYAIGIAIALVYMILAAQFESLVHPFTILLTLPLSVIGIFLGLYVSGKPMSMPGLIGILMLAGIVVNNAIIMIDYILRLRKRGMGIMDSVLMGCGHRLRPVLMTSLTTILGMVPLAMGWGEGSLFYIPLAVTVIGGLTVSTMLTLFIVPSVFFTFESIRERFRRKPAEA
jgi:hydrophobic/amphiphilic exporter-1 (mainly G- bacteria), HAE1 family